MADYKSVRSPYFIMKKEILWESDTADESEVNRMEAEHIRIFNSTNPNVGYNR